MTRCWVMAIWSCSHSGRRTDTGDRMWFYILSNAAMQCIGQTKSKAGRVCRRIELDVSFISTALKRWTANDNRWKQTEKLSLLIYTSFEDPLLSVSLSCP